MLTGTPLLLNIHYPLMLDGSPHRQVRVLAAEVRQEAQSGLREVVAEWQEHNPKFLLELRKSHWVIFANIGESIILILLL